MALLAIRAFFPTPGEGAIGSLDYPSDVRQKLALKSLSWKCTECGADCATALPEPTPEWISANAEMDKKLQDQVAQMQIGVRVAKEQKADELKSEDEEKNKKESEEEKVKEEKVESKIEATEPRRQEVRVETPRRRQEESSTSENILSILTLCILIAIIGILLKKAFSSSQISSSL